MPAHTRNEWKDIVGAIEQSIPLYESISERISFNLAGPLRRRAIAKLNADRDDWILDAGAGPGVSSKMMISAGYRNIVGLDPSRPLLTYAKTILGEFFQPVVGVMESLPFRDSSFGSGLTCFALRDVQDPGKSVAELARNIAKGGVFCIVDIGKPDAVVQQALIWFYIRHTMPRLALVMIRRRIKGNPFRMIVPTFSRLLTNQSLKKLTMDRFGQSRLHEFMLGGLIIIASERTAA